MTDPVTAHPTPPRRRWHALTYSSAQGPGGRIGIVGRQTLVDIVLVVVAVGFGLFILIPTIDMHSRAALILDVGLGTAACGSLAVRRRFPTTVAAFAVAASAVSASGAGASLVALFTAAIRVRTPAIAALTAAELVATFCFPLVYPEPAGFSYGTQILMGSLMNLGVVGWGLMIRAQRNYLRAVLDRAHDLEVGQELLAATVRDQERRRIAREMHDALAHRLSLLSVHAGALQFRSDLPADQIRSMAAIIRQTSHDALGDLQDVIGILRDGPTSDGSLLEPRVGLDDLSVLVDESRRSGTEVTVDRHIDNATGTSRNAAAGATAYRIVQEGLTNARKHAPRSPVRIVVRSHEAGELAVTVSTFLDPGPAPVPVIPGTGTGLSGLNERVSLLGGTFSSGKVAHQFVVTARLPWGT
ncbi:histidine kinase [Micromonospora sp. NPDC050686]|uniref:sensor histidine kinase n=1 Tax=Micromonospora sp. NPDC050686 TaxID=3154631 RepID=UPI0033CD5C8C